MSPEINSDYPVMIILGMAGTILEFNKEVKSNHYPMDRIIISATQGFGVLEISPDRIAVNAVRSKDLKILHSTIMVPR